MKILMIGGNFSTINGYTNAVASIAETIGGKEEACLMPLFPLISRRPVRVNSDVTPIQKKVSIHIGWEMLKKYYASYDSISKYVYPFGLAGICYLLNDMFHRCIFEEVLDRVQPDVVHVHGIILDTLPFIEVLLEKNIPFCVTLHALALHDPNAEQKYDRVFETDTIKRLIEEEAPISAVSRQIIKILSQEMQIPSSAVEFIPNGVDIDRFSMGTFLNHENVRNTYKIPLDKKVFLQVGTLSKRKNQIAMLEAISQMPGPLRNRIHYVAIGDGPEKENLICFAKDHNIDEFCTFTGRVSDEERDGLYLASDFFILPSTSEGMALVMLEAMAAGLPVVTFSSLEGIDDIYCEECFHLIPKRNIRDIINTIESALERNWERKKIVNHVQKWTWEAACDQYHTLFEKALRTP